MQNNDAYYMSIALKEARHAQEKGNHPIGAVLLVNSKLIAHESNRTTTELNRIAHAEANLFMKHSQLLRTWKQEGSYIELYTTFEPCLMCLGMAIIHRVDRIIVACHDPRGDISQIQPRKIGRWYEHHWPVIEYGILGKESHSLFINYLQAQTDEISKELLSLFQKMPQKYLYK